MTALGTTELTTVCARLEQFSELAIEFYEALERGDGISVLALSQACRSIRVELERAPMGPSGVLAAQADDRWRLANERAELGSEMFRHWFERDLTSDADPLLIADRELGPVWNIDQDVVAIVGGGAELAGAFKTLDQARIVAYACPDATKFPAEVTIAATVDELRAAAETWSGARPARLSIVVAADVSDDDRARLCAEIEEALA